MKFTDNNKNRLIAMLDYVMARSTEFGGVEITMTATRIDSGVMVYSAEIGCSDDGVSVSAADDRKHRWYHEWQDGEIQGGGTV